MKVNEIKRLLKRHITKRRLTASDYVSTGSTLLNLACTGHPTRGFAKGYYYFLVGDSTSGKTFLGLTCLAEAATRSSFKKHRFIYDNSEGGALMDIRRFFGAAAARRIEAPSLDANKDPYYSYSIEDFYYHIDDAVDRGQPFIYILDSMDSLTSKEEIEKFQQTKKNAREGKKSTGTYGDGKAKRNSSGIRQLLKPLQDTGSILIVICQTRDNLGFGFEKKTRSGGHALRFYATLELWSSVVSQINKTVKGKPRQLGNICRIKVRKNRTNGRLRQVDIPIYHSYGIDDIGSCVDYLIEEGHWTKTKQKFRAPEFKKTATREALIKYIINNRLENTLRNAVGKVWDDIEKACELQRPRRYG